MVLMGNLLGARFCLLAGLALVLGANWVDTWCDKLVKGFQKIGKAKCN